LRINFCFIRTIDKISEIVLEAFCFSGCHTGNRYDSLRDDSEIRECSFQADTGRSIYFVGSIEGSISILLMGRECIKPGSAQKTVGGGEPMEKACEIFSFMQLLRLQARLTLQKSHEQL
jgi:hypothetical protein